MSIKLKFSHIAITIFVFAVPVAYCEWLSTRIAPDHWAFGFSASFVFLAASTTLLTLVRQPCLPATYFEPKPFERNGRIYSWAGIQVFVGFLRLIGWERFWRRSIPVRYDESALRKYSDSTKGSETVHLLAAITTALFTLTIAFRFSIVATKWLWIFNVLVNGYPVILQRYNRPRVDALLRRLERKRLTENEQPSSTRELAKQES